MARVLGGWREGDRLAIEAQDAVDLHHIAVGVFLAL